MTTDHQVYHGDAFNNAYQLWKDSKTGFLSTFPFGAFAFARLDERLADSELWKSAPREPNRDPMGLTSSQPNIEFFSTECYGGPKQYDQFPVNNKHAFSIIVELFRPRSRGTVTLRDTDAKSVPVVDCGYLNDPLDLEVLAEACRFGNEIIMQGKGTKDIVKGAWPATEGHHEFKTREDWIPYVKKHATTCKLSLEWQFLYLCNALILSQATTPLELVKWASSLTLQPSWMANSACLASRASVLPILASCRCYMEATLRCLPMELEKRQLT